MHVLMKIACQFHVGKWVNKPSNLSSGTLATMKLAKHILNSDEVYSLDSNILYSDGYSYS